MNILVTGATGFIGGRLAESLLEQGHHVAALCRPFSDATSLQAHGIEIRTGDILNSESLVHACEGIDRIFHLAAYARNWARYPERYMRINAGGLRNMLTAALESGVGRVVIASSEVTMGPSNGIPVTEVPKPNVRIYNEYQRSKIVSESVVEEFLPHGLEIVTVNPTRLFGPGSMTEGNSVTKMIQLYLAGKWRLIPGDGEAIGSYAFIRDVVSGFIAAMQRGRSGERYILGGENISYNEFFRSLSELSGKNYTMFRVPPPVATGFSRIEELRARLFGGYPLITPGWVRMFLDDWATSSEKADKELGYTITPFTVALRETVGWLRGI